MFSLWRPWASAWLGLFLLTGLGLSLLGCSPSTPSQVAFSGPTMGTRYLIRYVPPPGQAIDSQDLQAEVTALLERINAVMSTYDPESELSQFNRYQATDWFPVSPELVDVVQVAQAIAQQSHGVFDITVGPLVNLWGFGPDMGTDALPDPARIDAARKTIGYHQLAFTTNPPALRKTRTELYVDLSAVAKGYAADRVADRLATQGIDNYLVEIGGELRLQGGNGQVPYWRIAVEKPDPRGRLVERVLAVTDCGVATSGDYRNFFVKDGQRYSHIIDPRTGYPIAHRLGSVTVIADNALLADGRATALLALGPEAGLELAEQQGWAALFIEIGDDGGFIERESSALSAELAE